MRAGAGLLRWFDPLHQRPRPRNRPSLPAAPASVFTFLAFFFLYPAATAYTLNRSRGSRAWGSPLFLTFGDPIFVFRRLTSCSPGDKIRLQNYLRNTQVEAPRAQNPAARFPIQRRKAQREIGVYEASRDLAFAASWFLDSAGLLFAFGRGVRRCRADRDRLAEHDCRNGEGRHWRGRTRRQGDRGQHGHPVHNRRIDQRRRELLCSLPESGDVPPHGGGQRIQAVHPGRLHFDCRRNAAL